MLIVPIHKDVLSYEPKVVAFLTQRTLVFTIAAVLVAVALGVLLIGVFGVASDVAMYPIMAVTMPLWFFGYARPYKCKPEEIAPHWLRHKFLPQQLTYVSTPVLTGEVDPSTMPRRTLSERYPDHVRKVQRHYEKLRTKRGFEGDDPRPGLGF